MKYYFKQIDKYENPIPLFFLCGVKYNEKNPDDDKRVVLKKYLESKGCFAIILEENFAPYASKNNKKLSYKDIGLNNLNDVEALACMAVDGVFIIHESHSTAAEIALFASNEVVTKKTFVLVPDQENSQMQHFSGFLSFGYKNLLPKCLIFNPVTEKYFINEDKIEIKTYFNDNKIGHNLGIGIDNFMKQAHEIKQLQIIKSEFNKDGSKVNSYYIDSKNKIRVSLNVELLRYYIIAVFSIREFRQKLYETTSFLEGVILCEKWFKEILLNTLQRNEHENILNYDCIFRISNIVNSRLDLRKAISFILYIFNAVGWIKINSASREGITICRKTSSLIGFKAIYEKYSCIIFNEEFTDFEGIEL
ncbi:hypothetical protein FC826_03000 [Clostridium botulinum]|uniref:Uncharacterized protein n=1 Tax=Clostridium botulinum TaxID=1491 RepID=A0A6B4K4I0_CLOBO|nr:hypothetical protein [Clostridium sporogenes]NFD75841.1 hypothetical protein [Clostridium botulinum]MCW6091722.1 hypothetical protein [Clostridium sporogenes]MCW6091735.1 hypothetical protein [Clostridium sporogenes]NFD83746.1 hypothetical protein [Clostridium botulinum]NFE07718.1 hypothetical protein [Clostridium botulinum]